MTVEEIDDRILKRKKEQLEVATYQEQVMAQSARNNTKYAQLQGAINELQDLKTSFNGQSSVAKAMEDKRE